MKKSIIFNRILIFSQRRRGAKDNLSAFVPLWQKKIIRFFFLIVVINLFRIIPAYSQSDSLIKYLELAVKNNPTVLQKFAEYQASLQKIPQVGSLSDPQLSLGVFLKPMELIGGNQIADISLMQMFPWFGTLRYAKDEMSLMANAKFEIFRDSKLQVIYEVQRIWYELYKIQKNITVSEKNIEILSTIERLALVRFKAGPSGSSNSNSLNFSSPSVSSSGNNPAGGSGMNSMGGSQSALGNSPASQSSSSMQGGSMGSTSGGAGLSDIYRIRIESGELENNIAYLRSQELVLQAQINSFLNRPPATKVFTADILIRDSLNLPIQAVSDSILANNPMLGMLDSERRSLDARKNMVTAMGYPMVGLGLNYSLVNRNEMSTSSMNGSDMIMPMVTITLPVYRKKYNAMRSETELLKTAAEHNYQATVNTLNTEYYQALQLYNDAHRREILYENQFQLASKSFDLVLRSFSTSSSDLSEVLRVRQQLLDYELKKTEAAADFNVAVAWLRRLGNLRSGE
ncbi:MAG: TolC family protein [Bacteroidales bacterium]|nr:TolC family protein [Bacteroidales bacterium]